MELDRRHVGFEIKVVSNMLRRIVGAIGHANYFDSLTGSNTWIIGYLARHQDRDIFQKDLEQEFSIRRSTASKTLQLMEEKDLIRREPVFYDARLKKITLTEKALEIHKIVQEDLEEANRIATKDLSDEEIAQFFAVMEKIRNNLLNDTQLQGGK